MGNTTKAEELGLNPYAFVFFERVIPDENRQSYYCDLVEGKSEFDSLIASGENASYIPYIYCGENVIGCATYVWPEEVDNNVARYYINEFPEHLLNAVKAVKNATGMGLLEAKNLVMAMVGRQ